MKTVRQKAFAKVNLFLDIVGAEGGFHLIDSVATTISLFDEIILTSRRDKKIVMKTHGSLYSVTQGADNNVYRAAEAFIREFNTNGVDITLHKFVPVSSGLGGSSADIAGTLIGMEKLYGTKGDLKKIADSLGSDSGYLLYGGYARMRGRGEIVESLDINKKLYMVIACAKGGVNTAKCYKTYDDLPPQTEKPTAEKVISALKDGSKLELFNALYAPASLINEDVKRVYEAVRALSPDALSMSGSGSGVFGIFETRELCLWAAQKLKSVTKDVFVAETIDPKSAEEKGFFGKNVYS